MRTPRILTTAIATLLLAPSLLAVTYTWDGGGTDNNVSTANNWNPNGAPVSDVANTDLIFIGGVRLFPNLSSAFSAKSVAFLSTSAAFTLGSTSAAALTIGTGGFSNTGGAAQTISNPVTLGAATSTFSGPLTFSGTVDLGANALSVTGNFDTSFANLIGTGSVTKSGAGVMTWAPTATTSADIAVSAGTLTLRQDGSTDVFDSNASIAVNGTGTLNINENMVLDGGAQLTRAIGANLQVAFFKTLTLQGGSGAVITGDYAYGFSFLNVTGTGSDLKMIGGNLQLGTSGVLTVQDGGRLDMGGGLTTVNGAGSILLSTSAIASLADVKITGSLSAGIDVSSGADVMQTGNLEIFGSGGAASNFTLTIDGSGSSWTQGGGTSTVLGVNDSPGPQSFLNVQNGGVFVSGTDSFMLNSTATIDISDGSLELRGPLIRNGGTINFNSGTLSIIDPWNVGAGGLLGANVTLASARRFTTSATTTVDAFNTLTLNGGTLSTGVLVNNGALAFTSGTLAITGAAGLNIGTGPLGAKVTLGAGANLQVTNMATIASGASLAVEGGTFSAGPLANSGTLRANSGAVNVGAVTNASGGRIFVRDTLTAGGAWTNAAGSQLTLESGGRVLGGGALANGGLITGDGSIDLALTNNSGGEVRAAAGARLAFSSAASNVGTGHVEVSAGGDLQFHSTLANASAIDVIGGTFRVEGAATNAAATGRITGRDAILRFNGGLANSGSLAFSFGTSDVFGDIVNAVGTGRIVISGNSNATFYDDLVNSGTVQVSAGSTAVYFGAVSGGGSFPGVGTNFFEGDLSPGASPALVSFGGDVVYGSFLTTTMELAGTARGTGYDAINVAGKLTLNGTLNVPLLGGFQPAAGDTFNLFDWGTKAGTFNTVNLPALAPGLLWSQATLYTAGEIAVALDAAFTGRVWDGGGADNAWATDHNWDLNVEPLNNGSAALVFAGNVRLTPSVDTAWNVASITFDNSAGAFTITGPQSITLGAGGLVNNDADTQTITTSVTLSASQTFTAAAGDLAVANLDLGAHTLTIAGAEDVALGDVTGTGTVHKTGAGTLDLLGAIGTGAITLDADAGTTHIAASQTFAALTIGDGAWVVLGASLPAPVPAQPVPEPRVLSLLLGALAWMGGRRARE